MRRVTGGTTRSILWIGAGLAAFAAFFAVLNHARQGPEAPDLAATAPAVPAPGTAPETAPSTAPEGAAPEAVTAEPVAPSVDVIRVAPDGAAVVAGRAQPGANVTLYAGDTAVAEAHADASGDFVAIFQLDPSSEPRALTLGSETPDGARVVSEQVVVLLPEPPGLSADLTPPATPPDATQPDATPPDATPAAAAPVAAAIVSPGAVTLTPLARPTGAAAERVSLASISYAEAGEVTLDGFGRAGSKLRAYVDDSFAREGEVGVDGRWRLGLGEIAAGVHRLRIDQIGPTGAVESRVVTPFQRDYPQPRPAPDAAAPVSVVVQPGNNLWTLARVHYGSGVLYTQIFTANSDLIGDPNLIYPGQIFRLPEGPAVE